MNKAHNVQDTNETSRSTVIANLAELVANNETALLVTCGSDHVIRSRPMLNVNERFEGELYFLTHSGDDLVRAIKDNPRTNVSIAEPASYASITGSAEVKSNMKKAELLWNERCTQWFGMEKPSDKIVVIKIDVEDAEYWDQNQSLGYRFAGLFQTLTGGRPSQMDVSHEKVGWGDEMNAAGNPGPTSDEGQPSLSLMNHHK